MKTSKLKKMNLYLDGLFFLRDIHEGLELGANDYFTGSWSGFTKAADN